MLGPLLTFPGFLLGLLLRWEDIVYQRGGEGFPCNVPGYALLSATANAVVGALAGLMVAAIWHWRRKRKLPKPGHCAVCSYNLTGNVSGVCPECGTAIPIENHGTHPLKPG